MNLFITQGGLKLLKKIDRVIDQAEETLTVSLSKQEMDQLLQLLNKINLYNTKYTK